MILKAQSYQTTDFLKNFMLAETISFKKVITEWRDQNLSNKHATESIVNGFENCLRGISGLERTLDYLNDGVLLLFGTDIPLKLENDSKVLSKIANQNAHLYSGFLASVQIISRRYNAIQSIVNRLLLRGRDLSDKNSERLNLQTQLNELKRDFIILAETELLLLERLLPTFQSTSLKQMKKRLKQSA